MLFSAPMVRAILDGRKSMTRRVIKDAMNVTRMVPDPGAKRALTHIIQWWRNEPYTRHCRCPYGQPGDRIWVRETHALEEFTDGERLVYRADLAARWKNSEEIFYLESGYKPAKWLPSLFMPRWACRITLEITAVRVERLQDMPHKDAWAEGVIAGSLSDYSAFLAFKELWESINGPGSWALNPWVWVIEYRRV